MEELDIVTCFKELTASNVIYFISSLRSVMRGRGLSFHIVSPEITLAHQQLVAEQIDASMMNNCDKSTFHVHLYSDRQFLGDHLYYAIYGYKKSYISVHQHSFGWIVQQLIKLYAPFRLSADVLIFDSDSYPLYELPSLYSENCISTYPERNNLYRDFKSLLTSHESAKIAFIQDHTRYICQHMYLSLRYMRELCAHLNSKYSFCDSNADAEQMILFILAQTSRSRSMRFSEYEIYAVFVIHILKAPIKLYSVSIARHAGLLLKVIPFHTTAALYRFLDVDIMANERWTKFHHIGEVILLTLSRLATIILG